MIMVHLPLGRVVRYHDLPIIRQKLSHGSGRGNSAKGRGTLAKIDIEQKGLSDA
jgi:hypothetical protein